MSWSLLPGPLGPLGPLLGLVYNGWMEGGRRGVAWRGVVEDMT